MSIGSAGVPGDPGKVLCESVVREGEGVVWTNTMERLHSNGILLC